MERRVLIIDDEKLITATLKRLLKREGFKVTIALSGAKALEKIQQADFDLIIADIKMPQMDGVETVKRIRDYLLRMGRDLIPEIFITGYVSEESYQQALALNAADYIEKPFDVKRLLQAAEKCFRM